MHNKKEGLIFNIAIIVITVLLILLLNTTYATETNESFNLTLKDEIIENDDNKEVIIHTYIDEINIEKGIIVYQAKINYDENIFEGLEIEGTEEWNTPTVKNNKLIGYSKNGKTINDPGELFVIKLKVKENVKDTETNIEIADMQVANTQNLVKSTKNYEAKVQIEGLNNSNTLLVFLITIAIILILANIFVIKRIKKKHRK